MFQSILVLCLGNICRSPLAERLLQHKTTAEGLQVRIESAGLTAMVGDPAHPSSVKMAEIYGFSLQGHIARQVTLDMVKQADLILVMDDEQRRSLERQFQHAAGKTYRLGHFSNFDVPDPYGQEMEAFEKAYQLIDQAVNDWLKQLR